MSIGEENFWCRICKKFWKKAILPYETYKHVYIFIPFLCSLPWTRSCLVGGWDLYERLEEYTQPCKGPRLPIFNVLLLSPYESSPREIWLCEPGRVSSNFYMRQFRLGAFRTTQQTVRDSKCVLFFHQKKTTKSTVHRSTGFHFSSINQQHIMLDSAR